MSEGELAGKTVILTGGAQGIGLATAAIILERGASVLLVDRNAARLEEAFAGLADHSARVAVYAADIGSEEAVDGIFAECGKCFGTPDGVVNNAGIVNVPSLLRDLSLAEFERVFRTNVVGTFLMMRAAIRAMAERGAGSIVNIGSVASRRAIPFGPAYIPSKHAVLGLSRVAAIEESRNGIRCNTVLPGMTYTEILSTFGEPEGRQKTKAAVDEMADSVPMLRSSNPREVGEVVAFLLSDRSSYVSGAEFAVDGGVMAGIGSI